MPLSKVVNKSRSSSQSGTHAHYKEEFGAARRPSVAKTDGSQKLSKANSKDHEYRATRAEHFAKEAKTAHAAHAAAKTPEEKIKHEAVIAHAADRSAVHARFVTKNHPGSELADRATLHAKVAKHLHEDVQTKKVDAKEREKSDQAKSSAKLHAEEAQRQAQEAKKQAQEAHSHANAARISVEQVNGESTTHMTEEHFDAARDRYAKQLTSTETSAALEYSSHHAVTINRALRSGDDKILTKYNKIIGDLDTALKKHTVDTDTKMFRGIAEDPKVFEHYSSMKSGDTYTEKSYVSTSSSPFRQFGGADNVVKLEITVPKGGHASPIPSVKPQERELLLPRNQKFRVDSVERIEDWRGYHIKVRVTALHSQ